MMPLEKIPLDPSLGIVHITKAEIQAAEDTLCHDRTRIEESEGPVKAGDVVFLKDGRTINTAINPEPVKKEDIAKIYTHVLPVFSDALCSEAGYASKEAFHEHIYAERFREGKFQKTAEASGILLREQLNLSVFALDEKEIEIIMNGLSADTAEDPVSPEELADMFGAEVKEGEDPVRSTAVYVLEVILLGREVMRTYGRELDEKSYERYLAVISKDRGLTAEAMKEQIPYWAYLFDKYQSMAENAAEKEVKKRLVFQEVRE